MADHPTTVSESILSNRFKFFSGREEIPIGTQLTALSVKLELSRISEAEIECLDVMADNSGNPFPVSNLEAFTPGREVEIKIATADREESLFKGVVVKISQKAAEQSEPRVRFMLKHRAFRSALVRKSKVFREVTDSEVWEEILGSYGFQPEIDATALRHDNLVQFNVTDWDFLNMRAEASSRWVILKSDQVKIKAPAPEAEAVKTLRHGTTLLEFEGELDGRTSHQEFQAHVWNPATQEIEKVSAGAGETATPGGNLPVTNLAQQLQTPDFRTELGNGVSGQEALEVARSKMLLQNFAKIRGRARCHGQTGIGPGDLIQLENIGPRFGGKLLVSGVRHLFTLEEGWITELQLGLAPIPFAEQFDNVVEKPAAATLPWVSGLQIGKVHQLADDPAGEMRIQISLPLIEADNLVWARLATLFAGEKRSSFFLPEIGDEVIVGFLNDDPRMAVVLGALHSSAALPPESITDDNFIKGFYLRNNLKIKMDDNKNLLLIETQKGKTLTLDDETGVIKMEDEHGNIFRMGADGIQYESRGSLKIKTNGDISLEGMNITISAQAQAKLEGSGGVEVSSAAMAVLKGSLVKIN